MPKNLHIRTRLVTGIFLLGCTGTLLGCASSKTTPAKVGAPKGSNSSPAPTSTTTTPPSTVAAPPSDRTIMKRIDRITGKITPKSVTASPTGLVSAQSMMYSHNVTWYDPATRKLVATIDDSVNLSEFGIDGHPGTSQGAPVESVFTSDGKYEYVSNYSMYGENFGPEGLDSCSAGDGTDTSFVYRISVATKKVDQVIQVGAVPKFMALTPNGRYLLVSNWCSWSLSVIDTAKGTEFKRIDLGGRYPRGVVASPDSKTAYVAMMGSNFVASVDLGTSDVTQFAQTGAGPRHIVVSPDGEFLYVTNNTSGTVTKVRRANGAVVATHHTGDQPRSMAISSDGKAVYVVNYESSQVSKLATSDLSVIDSAKTDYHPIGIAYEPTTKTVWVACYGGSLLVFSDTTKA